MKLSEFTGVDSQKLVSGSSEKAFVSSLQKAGEQYTTNFLASQSRTNPVDSWRNSHRDAYDAGVRGSYAARPKTQIGVTNTLPIVGNLGAGLDIEKEITANLQEKERVQQQLNTYAFENNGIIDADLSAKLKSLESEVDRLENIRSERNSAAAQQAQREKVQSYIDKSGQGDKYFTPENLKKRQAELDKERKRLKNQLASMGANNYDAMLDPTGKQLEQKQSVERQLEEVEAEMRFIANSYAGLRDNEVKQKVETTAPDAYKKRRTADAVLDAVAKLLDAPHTGISGAEEAAAVKIIEQELGLTLSKFGGDTQALARAAQAQATAAVAESRKAWEAAGMTKEDYTRMIASEERDAQQKKGEKETEAVTEFAESYPTLASIASIIASPAQGVDFLNQTLRYSEYSDITDLDKYVPADTSHMGATNFVSGVRATVGGRLADTYTAKVLDQNVASFLYNTGMSAADSLAQVAALGPASIYVMGLSSAANTAKAVAESGSTNGQAFAMGMAAGVAEALCEKFSVEGLIDMISSDNVYSLSQAIGKVFVQAGTEATEEFTTEIANLLADAYIMKGDSEFRKLVNEYSKTMSEKDAVNKALGDCLKQAGVSAAAGALSGFASGGLIMGSRVTSATGEMLPFKLSSEERRFVKTFEKAQKQAGVSPAASPEAQTVAQQAEVTKQENPKADVLDAATTMYLGLVEQQGKNSLKKAKLKADVVQRLIAGQRVEDGEINALDLTSAKAREVFTQLTGVQFPDGSWRDVQVLRQLARSAHDVAQKAQQAAQVQQVQVTAEQLKARVDEARTAVSEQSIDAEQADVNGDLVVGLDEFRAEVESRTGNTDMDAADLEQQYTQWLNETAGTIEFNGKQQNFTDFLNDLRSQPDADTLTVDEAGQFFQRVRAQQMKEAEYGRQDLVHREGLHGQTDESARGQGRPVSEEAGRVESDEGTRRGDQARPEAGRSSTRSDAELLEAVAGKGKRTELNGHELTEIPREAYVSELHEVAARFESSGARVHIVVEGYPIGKDADGNMMYADGVTVQNADGTTDVYLSLQSVYALVERADHELGHVVLYASPGAKEQAILALADSMTEEELLELVQSYVPIYGAAYADSEDLVGDIIEEIVCDAYAQLNREGAGAQQYHDTVASIIEAHLNPDGGFYGQEITLTDDAGSMVVETDGNGHSRFSVSTYDESGRGILSKWLAKAVAKKDLTQQEATDIMNTMELIYDICQEVRSDYAPFDAWCDAKVVVNEKGVPVFSVVKANGDYAMNLDFSLVCKKRRTLDAVLNELVRKGVVDNLALNEEQIVKINDLIRSYGFEVACDLCFVDAKRYRQGKVADDFVKLYNDMVKSMIPEGSNLQPHYFNFGQSTTVTNEGVGIHELSNDQLDFTHINEVLKTAGKKSVEYKTAQLLKNSPADRKLTMRGDFLSTRGFDAINRVNPRVLKLFNSKKGSGGPKSAVSDVQYLNEVLTSRTFNADKAYAVGGVRIQSFSDYVPRMVFDYVQMIADLAAKKLPAHAYTKEQLFVLQFGLTGMKINMSLIPKVVENGVAPGLDADGNYAWADESFDFNMAKKIQKAEGYSRNCGTIAVGVSDEHIRKLMADSAIRMVIPYHKSGLNPVVAKMNKIDAFVNYTDYQNTRHQDGKKLNKDVAADKKLLKEMPNFNLDMRELGDPRAAAEKYVRWCEEHDLLPKFDQFAYKQIDGMYVEKDGQRVVDENYYKLLVDFAVYDNGQYTEQTGLTTTFPTEDSAFGSMKELVKQGLSEDALLEAKRDEAVPKIAAEIEKMKFSIAGENAKRANKVTQTVAKITDTIGIGPRGTHLLTGWWKGVDGKWRFEVDDSEMTIKDNFETAATLSGVVRHPELFRQYPALRRLKVEFADWGLSHRGSYDFDTGVLTLNRNLDEETLRGTILHEVQHWIQETEGRSVGSNKYTSEFIMFADAYERLKDDPALKKIQKYEDRVKFIEHAIAAEHNKTLDQAYFDGYKDALGEREARSTSERKNLSKKERRVSAPYLADTGLAYNRAETTNSAARYLDAHTALGYDVTGPNRPYSSASWWTITPDTVVGVSQNAEHIVGRPMDETFTREGNGNRIASDAAYGVTYADERSATRELQSGSSASSGVNSNLRRVTEQPNHRASEESGASILSDFKYSITPRFEQWFKETYGVEAVTNSQVKNRIKDAEKRAEKAERNLKAAELKNTFDKEMNLTAWMVHHTKKLREQKRVMNEKLDAARKEKTEAVRAAVAETKMVERAKAEVQHDADRMAERRNAAKRLRTKENAYAQKVTDMKENFKLKRNAAKAVLRDVRLAEKRRNAIETEQGLVNTIRQNPKQRTAVEKLRDAANELRVLGRTAYRNFVNQAAEIDAFSKRQVSDMRAGTLVNIVGGASSTMENVFKKGLVDRAGNRIGESMSDVFLCWDAAHKNVNEDMQALLQDFMLHWHNIDRMSIESRAASALETFENTHEWLRDMDSKEFARLVAMTEKELEKNGKQEAHRQAVEYARLIRAYNESKNKPIFADDKGNPVTASTSQEIVNKYLAENDWLLDKANGIYEWWDKFMREWAVGDTITEAEYNRMREMYPHYVPTYRADKNGVGGANFVGAGGATVSKAVKRARGGTSEVMNIEDSFSNIVSKIIRLNRVNELYMNIIDTAMLDDEGLFSDMAFFDWDSSWQSGEYEKALELGALLNGDLIDTVDENEKAGLEKVGNDYKLTGWLNGRKYTAFISEALYKSIGNVTGHLSNDFEDALIKVGNTLTGPMKTAITGINPTFAVRNLSRDLPTAVVNSISGLRFPKYYAKAAAEIAKNTEHWQTFQALGGTHATYYNDNKGFVSAMTKRKNPASWTVEKLGAFNEITEAQTRFAEYLATIDKLGDTYENRLQGIKNAAEVTVDFSRKGRYGKSINAWVPYWNPAVQGIDKVIRSVIDSPDGSKVWKQASKTLGRAAMTAVLFEAVLQGILLALGRDDEWEELNDRTKDTYYCIPLKDSKTFLKIPKNREWGAILGTPFMRILEWANGREDPFENYIETAIEPNFLPPAILRPDAGGGFTSDLIGVSQALDIAKNEDFAGRTIVPYAYQQGSLSQQFDSETSWFAKQMGEMFNWSPMQIDYIISDYFGDFGDMFIQFSSEATWTGEQNPAEAVLDTVTSPFIADARYSNYAVNKYYDLMDDLGKVVQDKKNQLGNEAYKQTVEYQTNKAVTEMYGDAITELNRVVREMPDGAEKDQAKSQIAQLAAEAIQFYEDSMTGKVNNPILTAEYNDFSSTVTDELIRMDGYSTEYKFKPTGTPRKSYDDPYVFDYEYVLTDDQKDYFKNLYREVYNRTFETLIQSSWYASGDGEMKASYLEDARDDVLDETNDLFVEWLVNSGAKSTPKKK